MVSRLLVRASESAALERVAAGNRLTRRVAMRFVAGEALDDGVRAAKELAAAGHRVSLDLVGEHVGDVAAARAAADGYRATVEAIGAHELPAGLSVKPSQLGSTFSPGVAQELLEDIAAAAAERDAHVTLDMEDSSTTGTTVRLVEALQEAGHRHVGCAVQAYLHRTPDDIRRLSDAGASLRLCKGAYAEPARLALQRRADVDRAFRECAVQLLDHGTYPRFATHDHRLIGFVRTEARRRGLTPDDYEFQLLYGVRPDLQERLVAVGERVCVYVPFGSAWYPYFMRRLAERPANVLFLLRALQG